MDSMDDMQGMNMGQPGREDHTGDMGSMSGMRDMGDMGGMGGMGDMSHMQGMGAMGGMGSNHNMKMPGKNGGTASDSMMHGGQMMHMGNLKRKFWVCLVVSIPVLLFSSMAGMSWWPSIHFPGSDWIALAAATFLYCYGGEPFLRGAGAELRARKPEMMTLIALGITASYFYSLYVFIYGTFVNPTSGLMGFFWELATLIDIMLLGHWIEMNALMGAGNALQKIASLLPSSAHVVDEQGHTHDLPLAQLRAGQQVRVFVGEKIPADGSVSQGDSDVNESLVTGESKSVRKGAGSKVIGGSTNGSGTLTLTVSATGRSGYLAQVMNMVSSAQSEKSQAESLADRVAGWLFYVALAISIVACAGWLITGSSFNFALSIAVTVLVIACPHALGLAIPLVTARSTSIGAQHGLLIRKRQALETARKLDVVLLDKTGTLTQGNFAVSSYCSLDSQLSDTDLIGLFAALEQDSSHPLAAGIVEKAKSLHVSIPSATQVKSIAGTGLSGLVDGRELLIVNPAYLRDHHMSAPSEEGQETMKELSTSGQTVSYLLEGERLLGFVAQGDQVKASSAQLVAELKAQGIRPAMVTGDSKSVALAVARQIGIEQEDVHAELRPEEKQEIVRSYQADGHVLAMVGDGINDAPSLVQANIGIAIGAGTDVAIDSADVVLVRSDPTNIIDYLHLAKRTTRKMVENLWFGAGYNIVAIPLAAGLLAPIGIILNPAVGALLMGLSTIVVAINAESLR
ncbi:copper-translocating P-type ATPase [Bombiscardovia apis]|uniref:Copper-translocating P-type ATPase n=1 Tax=Bombiscardovia apis TaxID=2932182 RepID=A0ABM8BAM5_9BIFI|nr:copper-translocating P-type ATPase [Bombiscardovia apis]BDR53974.1 copper-translocating P-type ATPase [Bombiscardovia apis]